MHGITEELFHLVAQHWLTAVGVVLASWLIRNRYRHGLNKYPGPFLASLTDWWRFVDVWNKRPELTHIKLHEKHGDVVRLGPNTISFSSPTALKAIYGLNKGFVKVKISRMAAMRKSPANIAYTVGILRGTTIRCQRTLASKFVQYNRQ